MPIQLESCPIEGLFIVHHQVHKDERGYFYEAYNEAEFKFAGIEKTFIQDNQALSGKHILRGLHFQIPPHAQAKLVRVVKGAVYDVAVDLRLNSKTYGQHFGVELSEENLLSFYVPEGFAHGYLTLSDDTIFAYKCSDIYNKDCEEGIAWDDPILNIDWHCKEPLLSMKDQKNMLFKEFKSPFL